MTSVRRHEPLRAPAAAEETDPTRTDLSPPDRPTSPADQGGARPDVGIELHEPEARERTDEDRRGFADAVAALRTGMGSLNLSERTLMVIGGIVAPIGLLVVLLGWLGASRTPNTYEQIPYVISGGMFGLALVFLGAFFYFTHWVTQLVKEHRASSAALLEAIDRLDARLGQGGSANGSSGTTSVAASPPDPGDRVVPELVATLRGSMAHRADCVVVAGKSDVRPVSVDDALAPCKLCDPYVAAPSTTAPPPSPPAPPS